MNATLAKKASATMKSDSDAPLKGQALQMLRKQLQGHWKLTKGTQLEKTFTFPDFLGALAFVNSVGKIAEKQGHHPDIFLTYGEVHIRLSTHRVKALTESDFILAEKINRVK
jgi:4a-hydroxytetrahydrobiopterin dehydratase